MSYNYRGVKFEDVETLPEVGGFFHGDEVKAVNEIDSDGERDYFEVQTLYKESMFDDDSKGEPYTYYVCIFRIWIATEEEGRADFKTFAETDDDIADMEPDCDYSKDYIKGFNDAKAEWLKQHAND